MPTYLERLVVEQRSRLEYFRDRGDVDGIADTEAKLAKARAARAKESAAEWATWEALHPPIKRLASHGSAEAPYEERYCPNCDRVCAGELCVSCGLDEL